MKSFILFLFLAYTSTQVFAQKVFQTKTGTIKFYSSTPLENIEAINPQVNSKVTDGGQVVFALLIRGFVFKNALMQEHFNENYMESNVFPKAMFVGKIDNIESINFSKDGVYPATVSGDLEIHGVKQHLSAKGTVQIAQGKPAVKTTFKLTITDFGIKGKYIGEKIAKEVDVTVDCKYE